ncbi:hypothetical protein DYB32_001142 [Aphanomyces invadans]|uniref:Uncharacterized protein n=1 Tax=Aphanomyces invadans TaxID=157072 RepID=A0A3R6W364_9STRA|nr:hypothetical protein DYB32_001142 [Aphanomyces invadans]
MEFYPAYAASDKEGYVEAFKRDGFVVIDNVLTGAECEASCGEIWDYLEHNGRVNRDDATTWGNDAWPREVCRNGGFVGRFPYWKRMKKLDPTFLNKQPQSWRNRQNKVIYEVFSTLLEAEQLWVSIDSNFPNDGFNFRMVQYVKMIPTADTEFRPAMQLSKFDRAEWCAFSPSSLSTLSNTIAMARFPSDFTPTPLGNKLFGLDKW